MKGERWLERKTMVEEQVRRRGVESPEVLAAMLEVPRHWFVSEEFQPEAYSDRPLPLGNGQTISQPYIVGLMTEMLMVGPQHRVLEVGTGSGYQTAILCALGAEVYSIEIHEELQRTAGLRLADLGYGDVHLAARNGYAGWPEAAPFDRVMVTAGAQEIPPALLEQLAPGGRMVIPVGPASGEQALQLVMKSVEGRVESHEVAAVRFVPLIPPPQSPPSHS